MQRRKVLHSLIGFAVFSGISGPIGTRADVPPVIAVTGGIRTGSTLQPLVFTWNTQVPVEGAGWRAGEAVSISLAGPLNSPGVAQNEIALGAATADGQGAFSTSVTIPYDRGVTGAQANIPRPGWYAVRAAGSVSGTVASASRINLCPATYTGAGTTINWSFERGTRDGVLPGSLRVYSPERSDPEWISVWDNRPVEIYGTILGSGGGGADQTAHISREDDPLMHYGHDTNLFLVPDAAYRWTVGTANYFSNSEEGDSDAALGRIEMEWEVLNNGSPQTYGTGRIGVPDWAIPAVDDRVYVVGRWVLDAGHPEIGDRTELHPPRLLATMRQRPAVTRSSGAAAAQVDIYVSGHGGGANRYPSGMDALLNQGGRGGGRLRDVLSADDQQVYRRAGPVGLLESPLVNLLVRELTGAALDGAIFGTAGPSAFPWGTPAPEEQPINDMDYDFDVVLPPPPDGATAVNVEAITQAQHTTAVNEVISYPNAGSGLPARAHIHLPYRGADNGIYARTLKFSWSTAAPPPHHFRVTLNRIIVNALPGEWHLWSEVSGQWTYLRRLAPGLSQTAQGQSIATTGAVFDVYLRETDTLRVLVQGYRAQCIDREFGQLFGKTSYSGGIELLTTCGPVNNDDLGGALVELPALPSSQGNYVVRADAPDQTGGGAFQVDVTVEYAGAVHVSSECQGRGALVPAISASGVVGAGLSMPRVMNASPNALLTAFGQNFVPGSVMRAVTAADVADGALPTNLGCTCVAVNHRLAPLLFASATAVNFQAPSSAVKGPMAVQVIANCGAPGEKISAGQTVAAQAAAPEFFFFKLNAGGKNPIAAEDATSGALIGTSQLLPGATFTPAKPGEYVALFATGMGVTDPAYAAGQIPKQPATTVSPVSVSLNGVPLAASDVLYAGVAPGFAGLYQVNIRIPASAPDGDLPVVLSVNGISTPAGAYLTVQR